MNPKNRFTSVVFIAVFILAICHSGVLLHAQKEPAWVKNPQSIYAESQYLTEVGEGGSQNSADVNAIANLSRQFGVTAASDTRVEQRFQSDNGRMSGEASLQTGDSVAASHELLNTKIIDRYYNKKNKTYYAVAIMDKKQTIALLEKMVEENRQLITGYEDRVKSESDLIIQYSLANMAAILGAKNNAFVKQMDILGGDKKAGDAAVVSQHLRANADEIAKQITFGVISSTEETSSILAVVQQMLSDLKMKMAPQPSYIFYENFTCDFVDTGLGIIIANYVLQLDLKDQNGMTILSFTQKGKASGNTAERAKTSAMIASAKDIKEPLKAHFMDYLNSILK